VLLYLDGEHIPQEEAASPSAGQTGTGLSGVRLLQNPRDQLAGLSDQEPQVHDPGVWPCVYFGLGSDQGRTIVKQQAAPPTDHRPELLPSRVYNPAEIAAIMGDVSADWVTQQFPQFWIGKKWRALGRHFDQALSPSSSDARGAAIDTGNGDSRRGDTIQFQSRSQHV